MDEAFNAWLEENRGGGKSAEVLKKRYDDLVAFRERLISGGRGSLLWPFAPAGIS